MEEKFSFMAFAQGVNSLEEENNKKKYIGVGTVKVLCVNPTKAQLKEYMNYEPQEEPEYTGTREVDGKDVKYARITFLVQTNPDKNNGIKFTSQLSYFIREQYVMGQKSGKYQVVDAYGNTAWADEETIKSGKKIQYKRADGSGYIDANIIGKYRPAFAGEIALIKFIREYLGIGKMPYVRAGKHDIMEDNGFEWKDGVKASMDNNALRNCECSFDKTAINAMLNGDFSAVRQVLEYQPNNEIKVAFGIRVDGNSGVEYQDIYPRVIRARSKNTDVIEVDYYDAENRNPSTKIYEFTPLHEYKVEATNFESVKNSDVPPEITEDTSYNADTSSFGEQQYESGEFDGLPF